MTPKPTSAVESVGAAPGHGLSELAAKMGLMPAARAATGVRTTQAPIHIVFVTMDTHLASATDRIRPTLAREFPGLTLSMHAASEYAGNDAAAATKVKTLCAGNVKRPIVYRGTDWQSDDAQSPYRILDAQEVKTTWHPVGT